MEFILWIFFLLIGFPMIWAIICCLYNMQEASEGKKDRKWGYIFLVSAIVLLVLVFIQLLDGLFISMEHFLLIIIEIGLAVLFFSISISTFVGSAKRNKWTKRINRVLQGDLGGKLKKYLPSNSMRFWVYGDHIAFLERNAVKNLYFSTLGYKEFPAIYADVICRWIAKNILKNYDSYVIVKMYIEHERWEGGTSDYVQIDKNISGYEAHTVRGDAGHQVKTKETMGYTLMHSSLYANETADKYLKNW